MDISKTVGALFIGRINRSQFSAVFFLGWLIPIFIYVLILLPTFGSLLSSLPVYIGFPLFFLPIAFLALVLYGGLVRRIHDMGKPGWFILIPIISQLSFLAAFFLPGQDKENRYGQAPIKQSLKKSILNSHPSVDDKGETWIAFVFVALLLLGVLLGIFSR